MPISYDDEVAGMATVSVKLPQVLNRRLESAAAERGVSKSAVIRRALEREFGGRKGKRTGSFLARANDLVGRVAGPRDLFHAARYLRGYGRCSSAGTQAPREESPS